MRIVRKSTSKTKLLAWALILSPVLFFCVALSCAALCNAAEQNESLPWFTAALKKERIKLQPDFLLKELRERTIGSEDLGSVESLVKKLGSNLFADRAEATSKLLEIGPPAIIYLKKATRSTDLETATRARGIMSQLKSAEQLERDQFFTYALLKQIASDRIPGTTSFVTKVVPYLDLPEQRYAAQEAIWSTVEVTDRSQIEELLESQNMTLRAAAIVALQRLDGQKSIPRIKPFLKAINPEVRLAACRALINDDPRVCVPILVELMEENRSLERNEAWKFLEILTGMKFKSETTSVEKQSAESIVGAKNFWMQTLADYSKEKKFQPLKDEVRFRWGSSAKYLADFSKDDKVPEKYGDFHYSGLASSTAKVTNNQVILSGKYDTCDQRFAVSSYAAIGRPTFPSRFRVNAEVGGGVNQRGNWHVGIAVGNVRVVFCPGMPNGYIYYVRDDNNNPVHDYEQLGFTPTGDLLHSLSILVTQLDSEYVELDVSLNDDGLSHKKYHNKIIVKRNDIGSLDRVALIRIGDRGGDAMFRGLEIVEEM